MLFGSADDYEDFKQDIEKLTARIAIEILHHFREAPDSRQTYRALSALGNVWCKMAIEAGLSDHQVGLLLISMDMKFKEWKENA